MRINCTSDKNSYKKKTMTKKKSKKKKVLSLYQCLICRYVKGDRVDRVIILLNLTTALIISYIIFLAGVRQSDNEVMLSAALRQAVAYHVLFRVQRA